MIEANSIAGKILFANILRPINDTSAASTTLAQAAKPFFAIQFGREMLQGMDAHRFNVILTRLKRPILPCDIYKALVAHVKDSLADRSSVIPYVFEEWGC